MDPSSAVNWQSVDTVLLDMDGTLLDLRFEPVCRSPWHQRGRSATALGSQI
jgi:FMN phosphatase YigB (HAD superfamily)